MEPTKATGHKPTKIDGEAGKDRREESRGHGNAALLAAEAQLLEATQLAWRWHGHQTRKGKPTSYMSHLLQVQGLVLDCEGGPDEAIAALLHDSLEDAETPSERSEREERIEALFGARVLRIVLDCTDTTAAEAGPTKGPWRERKERYLAQLREAGRSSLLVAACDKRHNLGDLVADLRHDGHATLSRFNAGGPETSRVLRIRHNPVSPSHSGQTRHGARCARR